MTVEPLAYRAEDVPQIFPLGRTLLFQKLKSGEIESFLVGRARLIPRDSLIRFMERQMADQRGSGGAA